MPSAGLAARRSEVSPVSDFTECVGCGLAIDAREWRALRFVQLVAPERVREILTSWPSGTRIEVRECACGRTLARKVVGEDGGA
jgi:hypothetical protein